MVNQGYIGRNKTYEMQIYPCIALLTGWCNVRIMISFANQRLTDLHIESHSIANGRIKWCINVQTTGSLMHPCTTFFMNTPDQWAMHGFVGMGGSMRGSWPHDHPPESPSSSNGLINGRINEQHNGKWVTFRIILCLDRVIHCVIHVAMHCSLLCPVGEQQVKLTSESKRESCTHDLQHDPHVH